MAVTIKMISEISGVSRGTVDRVLNGRGNVNPKTEAHVRRVAEQLGYRPNLAGKALAVMKKSYTIGVLLTAEGNPFFDEVIRGVEAAEAELAEYGVAVWLRTIKGYDPAVQIKAMEEMGAAVNALILNPVNEPPVAAAINTLGERGISVITVNTEVEGARRLCHVGPDYRRNGETAGGLMALLLPDTARKLLVFSGSREISGHQRRVDGFTTVLAAKRPEWTVAETFYTEDDDVIAYERALPAFRRHPNLDGVYIAAAGTYGVCRAVLAAFPERIPVLICSDSAPDTRAMMERGVVRATICQEPYRQGYEALRRAFSYLVSAEQPSDLTVKCEIQIAENLDDVTGRNAYGQH